MNIFQNQKSSLLSLLLTISRRAWPPEDDLHHQRPEKRLFTPEIKRMLKDWLVRRRENPYPSRDEKKRLAIETGLTYTQICNWFANWRRKLKNSERERAKKSWGHLIKHYNTNARGNVEQFSISSEDSIWEEIDEQKQMMRRRDNDDSLIDDDGEDDDHESRDEYSSGSNVDRSAGSDGTYNDAVYRPNFYVETVKMEDCNYIPVGETINSQISSTMVINVNETKPNINKAKYKQKMMEKYLRDTTQMRTTAQASITAAAAATTTLSTDNSAGAELSKWLESAAKFTPNKNNYYIEWNSRSNQLEEKEVHATKSRTNNNILVNNYAVEPAQTPNYESIHHKDELDAAEALANLAFNCRQRMNTMDTPAHLTPMKAISS